MNWRQLLTSISGGVIIGSVLMARILQQVQQPRVPRNQIDEEHIQRLADEAINNAFNAIHGNDFGLLAPAIFPAAGVLLFSTRNVNPQHHHHAQPPFPAFDLNAFFHANEPTQNLPEPPHLLRDRLEIIGFDLNTVPEEFNDPITIELMEDPVIAITEINVNGAAQRTEHIYDRVNYARFNGNCPDNRQPFIEVRDAVELRSRITAFVAQQEQAHQAANASIVAEPSIRVSSDKRSGPSR